MLSRKMNFLLGFALAYACGGCQKTTTAPAVAGVAELTIVNAIPTTNAVIPVIGTTQALESFANTFGVNFTFFGQYSAAPGSDTVYVVQDTDTLDVGQKVVGQMYHGILPLKKGGIYSLFLCGTDTTSPDYLFTTDTLPYHAPVDSTVGIRFVNLSTGSNPVSVTLEGSQNGPEAASLPYKGITGFKNYLTNSTLTDQAYTFVFRDVGTGDSLTAFTLPGFNNQGGIGLQEPNSGVPLLFKNITIALVGQPGPGALVPQSAIIVDNY